MRKGFRRSLALLLLGTAPLGMSGCAACRAVGRATAVTARTTYKVTKVAVVGTAKATKKGIQAISRDPDPAPGGLEGTRVAYNPFDPDESRPTERDEVRPADAPRATEAGTMVVDDIPSAPTRGSQGVKHNLPSLDIETMIAQAKPARTSTRTK